MSSETGPIGLKRHKMNHPGDKKWFVMRLVENGPPVPFGHNHDPQLMTKCEAQCKARDLAETWKDHYVVCELVWETFTKPSESASHGF